LIGILLTPVVIKKDLAELEWLATLLFISIGIFIFMSLYLLLFDSNYIVDPTASDNIWAPKSGSATFGAFCTIMVAYGY
jgi:hypothetical protein